MMVTGRPGSTTNLAHLGCQCRPAPGRRRLLSGWRRFHRAAEVWAFAGFDPITDGSGGRPDRVGHLSKYGDPAFQDALYFTI